MLAFAGPLPQRKDGRLVYLRRSDKRWLEAGSPETALLLEMDLYAHVHRAPTSPSCPSNGWLWAPTSGPVSQVCVVTEACVSRVK